MGREDPTVITVTLVGGGPEDGLTVDVRKAWKAYRPPNARGAYKPKTSGATRWHWVPDAGMK